MFKVTGICDKCKKEETQDRQYFDMGKEGWQEVTIKISQYQEKKYMFCKECRVELGLFEEEPTRYGPTVQSVEEKLFEVISEIVSNQLDDRS